MCAILIKCIFLLFSCVFLQIIIWRLVPEGRRHALKFFQALPLLFLIFFGIGGVSSYVLARISFFDSNQYSVSTQFFAIIFFHFLASMIYILTYTVMTDFSPSMEMLKQVERNMPDGIPQKDVEVPIMENVMFEERYKNMLSNKMIRQTDEGFSLQWSGWFLANIFLLYRRMLGIIEEKGG